MTIKIVTDSTSDLPEAVAAQYDIIILPSYVNIGERSYLDQVELSRQEFYEKLPTYKDFPTTAAPAVGTFSETYERLAQEGATEILSIHLAASLSGMLNAARLGAQSTDVVPVTVFDSRQITMGLGLLAMTAAADVQAGRSMSEIVTRLEDRVLRTHVLAVLDTLEYLRRSGRVSWTEFGLGTLLRIKPIVHVWNGNVELAEKVRTHSRALRHLLERIAALGPLEHVALLHTSNQVGVETLREEAKALFPAGSQPLAVEVTPTIGAHVGPGGLGLACIVAGAG